MSLCACAKSRDLLKLPWNVFAVVLVDVDLPYWTSKVEHLVAFTAIFSNICTAHAQKRLFRNFRCKFRHRRSIRRPRFPIRVLNFSDLATFSVDFCILSAECPPYFYFRVVWPTDLESIPHASTPTSIIPTRFEVDMTINCRVIVFLSADTPRDRVTLTFVLWPFDFEQMSYIASHVTYRDTMTIRGHCACAESRDPWVGGQKQLHFWNPRLICLLTMHFRWLYDEYN